MREIKFRAWDNDPEKQRFYQPEEIGSIDFFNNTVYVLEEDDPDCSWGASDVILEQYTGLKDKNGVEIYEGDIVQGTYHTGYRSYGAVAMALKKGVIEVDVIDGTWVREENKPDLDIDSVFGCEVIGNIHENPELLESDGE